MRDPASLKAVFRSSTQENGGTMKRVPVMVATQSNRARLKGAETVFIRRDWSFR